MDDTPPSDIARLFDEHFDDVYGYLAYRLAPRVDAAADLAQEVFQAAMRTGEPLRSHAAARAWLLEIARNKVTDHLRAQVRRNHHVERLGEALAQAGASDGRDRGDATERAIDVARVMNELPDRFATLLEDKYILGLTVEAMAARHGTTIKAVESALGRARNAFRRAWRADDAREESMSCDKRT